MNKISNLIFYVNIIIYSCFGILTSCQMAAEFIAKMTKIVHQSEVEIILNHTKCYDNPIIDILTYTTANQLKSILPEFEISSDEIGFCKIPGEATTCCNDEAINLFRDFIQLTIVPQKQQINDMNTNLYNLIINEHNRNFRAFGYDDATFEKIFKDYRDFSRKYCCNFGRANMEFILQLHLQASVNNKAIV